MTPEPCQPKCRCAECSHPARNAFVSVAMVREKPFSGQVMVVVGGRWTSKFWHQVGETFDSDGDEALA